MDLPDSQPANKHPRSLANLVQPWTPETARLAALRSNQVQREAKARKPNPPEKAPGPKQDPKPEPKEQPQIGCEVSVNGYARRMLGRTRKQLDILDEALSAELAKAERDNDAINALVLAKGRLWEVEAQIAGRKNRPSVREAAEPMPKSKAAKAFGARSTREPRPRLDQSG